jgi:ribosomal protein S10
MRNATNRASSTTSNEVIGLLKLAEYQSNIRMQSESKYGSLEDIEKMAQQTAEIVNIFDKLSIESENKIPLPSEVRRWAVSTIFDCADRWEIRFVDVFNRLLESLGKNLLKESIRIQQVRDIFGARAVNQIKNELGLS